MTTKILLIVSMLAWPAIPKKLHPIGGERWREALEKAVRKVSCHCKESSGFVRFHVDSSGHADTVNIARSQAPGPVRQALISFITSFEGISDKNNKSGWYLMRFRFTDERCQETDMEALDYGWSPDLLGYLGSVSSFECYYLKPLLIDFK